MSQYIHNTLEAQVQISEQIKLLRQAIVMGNASGLGVNTVEHLKIGVNQAGTTQLLAGLPGKQIRVLSGRATSPDEVAIYFTDGVTQFEGATWFPAGQFILPPVNDVKMAHYVCGTGKPLSIVLSDDISNIELNPTPHGVAGFMKYCYTGFTGTEDPALLLHLQEIRDALGGPDLGNTSALLLDSIGMALGK